MLNRDEFVPNNTVVIFKNKLIKNFTDDRLDNVLSKVDPKRDWFDSNFYRCLPLAIGNRYGFVIKTEVDVEVLWNGGNGIDDVIITYPNGYDENNPPAPAAVSNFGYGIVSFFPPFILRTPSGVNLMTMNPINYDLDNAFNLTGVVESDNLRMAFPLNLKIKNPNVPAKFKAGTPLGSIIPIPRYYADSFELKKAEEMFSSSTIYEEVQTDYYSLLKTQSSDGYTKDYMLGRDIYGNKFPDHQLPNGKRV